MQQVDMIRANTTIPLSPSPFLRGATGINVGYDQEFSTSPAYLLYHPSFAKVLQQYSSRDAMTFSRSICEGTCEVEIIAPGFDVNCSTSTTPYHLATYKDKAGNGSHSNNSDSTNVSPGHPDLVQTIFDVQITYNYTLTYANDDLGFDLLPLDPPNGGYFSLEYRTMYKSTPGVKGTMSHHTCQPRSNGKIPAASPERHSRPEPNEVRSGVQGNAVSASVVLLQDVFTFPSSPG